MTLDEAIKHCEEVAYQKDMESGFETDNERYAMTDKERTACKECAEEHRQLAEWLKELKEQAIWIPCSKRLPKPNEYDDKVCKYYLIQTQYGDMYVAHYENKGWRPIDSFLYILDDDVIAWMPLPEPYKAESEG